MATAPATLHRLEPVHIFLAVFWAAATVLMVVAAWDQDAVRFALTVGADGLILLYLGTVAAWVRVTPTHLLVVNPFVRYAVPRHLIRDVNAEDYWFVPRMLVDGGQADPAGRPQQQLADRHGHGVGPPAGPAGHADGPRGPRRHLGRRRNPWGAAENTVGEPGARRTH